MRQSTRDRSPTGLAILALAVAFNLACGGEPDVVYVPGTGFREAIFVSAERGPVVRAQVGEVVTLSAQRRAGPWRAVAASEVAEGTCTVPSPPAELEMEVADDLTWTVYPEGDAVLNRQPRNDRKRSVRFDAPGRYIMTARSESWCGEPYEGDTLFFEIRP